MGGGGGLICNCDEPKLVESCCIRLHTTANTDAKTPNIVDATMLGIVAPVCSLPNRVLHLLRKGRLRERDCLNTEYSACVRVNRRTVRVREPASFWWENVMVVDILERVFSRKTSHKMLETLSFCDRDNSNKDNSANVSGDKKQQLQQQQRSFLGSLFC